MIRATIADDGEGSVRPWYEGGILALRVGEYLCHEEGVSPDRVTAVGRVASREEDGVAAKRGDEATICAILRPSMKGRARLHTGEDARRYIHFPKSVDSAERLVVDTNE